MTPEQQVDFGKWLRLRRAEMSLEKVSQAFQVSKSAWQRYERGERPIPLALVLRLKERYPDLPDYAIPDVLRAHERKPLDAARAPIATSAADASSTHLGKGPAISEAHDLTEFERRLATMRQAQSLVTKAFEGYDLPPGDHLNLHQTLVLLVMRNDISPDGLGEMLQWYSFEQRARKTGTVGAAPVPIGASRKRV